MSVLRIKTWIMTATCVGLIGLVAGDAHAFGGKLFGKKGGDCADPCANPCADPCGGFGGGRGAYGFGPGFGAGMGDCGPAAPVTQKVKVTEYVPTVVEETVTVMKPVTKTETYTAHRWECVPETVTQQVTVNKMITENVVESRVVTERVPVQKTVTVNETRYRNVMVTEMKSRTVTHKVQVPYTKDLGPTIGDRLKKICDPCYTPCPRTISGCKTEKVCETVCEPVTVCKKIAECVPVTKTVCTYECVPVQKTITAYECVPVQKTITAFECVTKTVPTPVTRTRCVPTVETVTKTVNVNKCVPYQATRNVVVCEPVQEKVKVTKLVPTVVEKDVVVAPAAPMYAAGYGSGAERAGLFDRLRAAFGGMKGKFGKKGGDCCGPAVSGAAAGCCH